MRTSVALRRFEVHLRSKGLRVTRPRQTILELAWSTHGHFTAEDIFQWARKKELAIARATVYRTLALLVEGGFLAPLDSGRGQLLYEHILGHKHHDHMICLRCGRIVEFRSPEIERLQDEAAAGHGFHILHHSLILEGMCGTCSREHPGLLAGEDHPPPKTGS
ncbi:MAG: Fur family transcriptional regulator [Planctomycetota bacterium]